MPSDSRKHVHKFVDGYGLCAEFGCDFQRGRFAEGQRIEIETVDGWVPGTFVRAVSSTDPNEEFSREKASGKLTRYEIDSWKHDNGIRLYEALRELLAKKTVTHIEYDTSDCGYCEGDVAENKVRHEPNCPWAKAQALLEEVERAD